MVFSSITFLFYFLPAALLLYYIVPGKLKNAVLFFLSLIFYAWGEPVYVVLMIFSTILDYTLGRIAGAFRGKKKAKAALFFSVVINLGLLCTFKYSGFVIRNIGHVLGMSLKVPKLSLPIGISFYAFQTMSYTIDVYRGKVEPQKSIIRFGAYVALFPQLIAGPIVRYETIAEELEKRVHSPLLFAKGAKRFLCGLAKKVLLANNIGLLWESMSA
ncbi:MAG: MBOAT family protein, partial [Lachnospiraceae bacterium]|nr:MBOAT family protein [Lachnospiraceae bacterium]